MENNIPDHKIWDELVSTKDESKINLEIYSDEIKRVKSSDNSIWMYIGCIFVPLDCKKYYLSKLNDLRCIKNNHWNSDENACINPCNFHKRNNTVIHYNDIPRSDARFKISMRWINEILNRVAKGDKNKLYLNILGLNLSNIDHDLFDRSKNLDLSIYNRFYRTALASGLNYFFKKYDYVTIDDIYHHRGDQSYDDLFPWHPIHRINLEYKNISANEKEIKFIDADHRSADGIQESNYIQLIDLALGAVYCCLHGASSNKNKIMVGNAFKPTLDTLLDRRKSPYSNAMIGSYYKSRFYRTYQVSFFPRTKMNLNTTLEYLDSYEKSGNSYPGRNKFYYDREITLKSPNIGLDRWVTLE